MSLSKINHTLDTLQEDLQAFKTSHNDRLDSLERKHQPFEDHINLLIKENTAMNQPREIISAPSLRPNLQGSGQPLYKEAFLRYVQYGEEDALRHWEKKTFSTVDKEGGFLLHPSLSNEIHQDLVLRSPMRALANNVTINSHKYEYLYATTNEEQTYWINFTDGTAGALQPNATPEFKKRQYPLCLLFSRNRATPQFLLSSSAENVERFLKEYMISEFAKYENRAFIRGNGTTEPGGLLTFPRAQKGSKEAIQELKVKDMQGNFTDSLLELQASLEAQYLPNAHWLMNRKTFQEICKLKYKNGTYIWSPQRDLTQGFQLTLLGNPVVLCDEMSNIPEVVPTATVVVSQATAEKAIPIIAFGDFKQGYVVVNSHKGITLDRDFSARPYVDLIFQEFVGGGVTNPDAVKILSIGA